MTTNLRFAVRQLVKAPGFSITVVLMLGLGIGATTAMFSLIEGILLRPLPFRDPERLVQLGEHVGNSPGLGVTARDVRIYQRAGRAFAALGGFAGRDFEISGSARPEEVHGARLGAGVLTALGVQPELGRVFTQNEDDAHEPVALIGDALWMNRFHRDPQVLGRSIVLDRRAYTVIGVMPRGFEFPLRPGRLNQAEVWIPLSMTADELSDQEVGDWRFQMVARVKDGISVAQAAQDAERVGNEIVRGFPASMAAIHIRGDAAPLRAYAVSGARPLLGTLFGAVAMILLIACANVATLMLVRAIRRRREIAMRLALGAQARTVVREALQEGLLLSVAGGIAGLGLAAAAIRVALRLLPDSLPRIDAVSIDGIVAGFALLLAVATGVLSSLAPAFAAMRTNLLDALKENAGTGTAAASHAWLRSALVAAEIAVALVLLTVSGALVRSYEKMLAVDQGFRPDHVLVAGYQLPLEQYATNDAADRFNRTVLERLELKPGVTAAGITNLLPATGGSGMAAYTIEGEPVAKWKLKFASFGEIDGDYFRAMGIPLLAGRYFTLDDGANAPLVVIVNQSMAEHSWPGQSAVGRRMHVGNPKKGYPWATVVGVVANTKIGAPDEPDSDQWYCPMRQPAILFGTDLSGQLANPAGGYIALRSALPPEQMETTLRATVASVDAQLAMNDVRPMTDAVASIEGPRRFNTELIGAFAAGSLLLAITGIYAVVAFSVSQRAREIAIRMALGAERVRIARLVLMAACKLALAGCACGVVVSLAMARLVHAYLFEVSATDPIIYGVSVASMIAMALAAAVLPAMRAASADPVRTLRAN